MDTFWSLLLVMSCVSVAGLLITVAVLAISRDPDRRQLIKSALISACFSFFLTSFSQHRPSDSGFETVSICLSMIKNVSTCEYATYTSPIMWKLQWPLGMKISLPSGHTLEGLVTEEVAWKNIYIFYAYSVCEDIRYDIKIHWHVHRSVL